jgi:hypothetical protein
MTISKFYSSIVRGRRTNIPTIDESRRDYSRMQDAHLERPLFSVFGPK